MKDVTGNVDNYMESTLPVMDLRSIEELQVAYSGISKTGGATAAEGGAAAA